MKRLEFRLETVLRLRQVQLETEQAKLHRLLAEQQRISASLENVLAERGEAKAFVCNLTQVESAELRIMSSFLLGLEARAGTFRRHLEENARSIQEQRPRVMQADRSVRLLTKLREKKVDEWKHEVDREIEMTAQEAWSSAQHLRKASSPEPPQKSLNALKRS